MPSYVSEPACLIQCTGLMADTPLFTTFGVKFNADESEQDETRKGIHKEHIESTLGPALLSTK